MKNKSSLFCLAFLLFCVACEKKGPSPKHSQTPQVQYMTHTITYQGETLAAIARWYTGNASNWQYILDHNPGLDIRRMRIGTPISIPMSMVIKQTPMPKPNLSASKEKAPEETNTASNNTTETVDPSVPAYDPSVAKMQEDALRAQEEALKAQEQAIIDAQNAAATANTQANDAMNNNTLPPSDAPPPANQEESKKGGFFGFGNVLKNLGGKGTEEAPPSADNNSVPNTVDSLPPTNNQGVSPVPPANDGKVKTRDELLKELTEDY